MLGIIKQYYLTSIYLYKFFDDNKNIILGKLFELKTVFYF